MRLFHIDVSNTDAVEFEKNCNVPFEKCKAAQELINRGFTVNRIGSLNGARWVFQNNDSNLLTVYIKSYAAMAKKVCENCHTSK